MIFYGLPLFFLAELRMEADLVDGKIDTVSSIMDRNAYFDMLFVRLVGCKANPKLLWNKLALCSRALAWIRRVRKHTLRVVSTSSASGCAAPCCCLWCSGGAEAKSVWVSTEVSC